MRKEVMYRDLPGGPLQLNFTDELPLCMFCSKCGMLSKNMFEDPKCHAFCSVCIFESSDRKKIHCKYENKEVSVDEMMPAVDIITIVMDQIVYCPNKGGDNSCERYFSLKDLEEHYLECEETKISCLTCGDDVKGKEWGDHAKNCPQQILQCRYCVVAVPRWKLEDHERVCNENPSAIRGGSEVLKCPGDSPSALMVPSQNYAQRSVQENKSQRFKAPDTKSPDVMNTNDGNKTTICIVCNRKVKNKNMNMHLDVCIRNSSATPVNSTWKDEHTSETTKTTDLVPKLGPAQVPPVGTHEEAEKFNSFSPSKPSTFHGETQTPALVSPTTIYPRLQSGVAEESASAYWPQQSENTGGLHDYCQTPALVSPTTICPRLQSGVAEESASAYWPQQSENTGGLHDYCQTTPQDYAIPVITNYVSESAQEDPSVYQPGESDRQRDDVEMDSDPLGDSVNSSFEVIYKAEARDDSHSHEQHPTTPAFQDGNRDRGAASPVVVSQPSSAGPATGLRVRIRPSAMWKVEARYHHGLEAILRQTLQQAFLSESRGYLWPHEAKTVCSASDQLCASHNDYREMPWLENQHWSHGEGHCVCGDKFCYLGIDDCDYCDYRHQAFEDHLVNSLHPYVYTKIKKVVQVLELLCKTILWLKRTST